MLAGSSVERIQIYKLKLNQDTRKMRVLFGFDFFIPNDKTKIRLCSRERRLNHPLGIRMGSTNTIVASRKIWTVLTPFGKKCKQSINLYQ